MRGVLEKVLESGEGRGVREGCRRGVWERVV